MKTSRPREVFVRAFQQTLTRSVSWIVYKLGRPQGGSFVKKGLFICMECGDVVADTPHHIIHKHANCVQCGASGTHFEGGEIVCAEYPKCSISDALGRNAREQLEAIESHMHDELDARRRKK